MAKDTVRLRDLRKELTTTRPVHPRLTSLVRAVKRLGVAKQDKDGEWIVSRDIAAKLKQNYMSTGIFGRLDSLAGELAQN